MNIAFYAPMKPPDAIRPSGDRTIGRLLMAALTHAGFDVRLASQLRTWSGVPDSTRLDAFRAQAGHEAEALITSYSGGGHSWKPDLWFTYHNYYKAPDLLGSRIAAALDMP
ncbi:MAG: glycosyltransferase family 1 protein, partial [Hyphomicrobiaceae bacterium]